MSVLLRKTNGPDRPGSVFTDQPIDAATITIGSSPDADIRLISDLVAPTHCTIRVAENSSKLSCARGHSIATEGNPTAKALTLKPGDTFSLADHKFESITPPSGFDLALKVSLEASQKVRHERLYKTNLSQTRLSPRLLTWTLVVAALLFSLLAPLFYFFQADKEALTQTDHRSIVGITDSIWSSGPLHSAHSALEDNCSACHRKLFQKVTTDSCTQCHQNTHDHVLAVAENPNLSVTPNDRCATCHREHNEPESTLIITSDNLCTDCHTKHEVTSVQNDTIAKVTGFGDGIHPNFKVSLAKPPEDDPFNTELQWPVVRVATTSAVDESQLQFDHEKHTDQNRVSDLNGDALTCISCHAIEPSGEHFKPLSFESNCATSGCHDLSLDSRNRIPHGLPDAAIATIQGYHLRTVGNSIQAANERVENCRKRPGKNNCAEKCTGTPFECATERAASTIEQHFTIEGCKTCHNVNTIENNDLLDKYQIPAVKLTTDFYRSANFDHASHEVMIEPGSQNKYANDNACTYCHEQATTSASSLDLLIPDIENCVVCHEASSTLANNVPLQCIDCHQYHTDR